ncbi:uncharacterized protein LOC122259414 [Penaeus japonicus]|uniref:uncharacterized protein LOC122259413 n=1 Tax=Penaeus japonicus TaxID=27405 RepID=UPI001C70D775|nr:uncharacterized protein LOC122259413 [Penaeus japonicus]XP_042882099.1 uncharacterized protein LOC122259414 [Penaeus japonicus]
MRTWTSLTVLSVAVVSTLSFPRPDAEYKIPTVGLGARSQFYVLHDDGTFKYGYDTGDGIYESAMANAPGDVSGSYGYKDASGADIKLDYTANDQGFLVSGSHLPVAPRVDAASPSPVEEAQVRSSALDDGSYSFSYETQSSSRHGQQMLLTMSREGIPLLLMMTSIGKSSMLLELRLVTSLKEIPFLEDHLFQVQKVVFQLNILLFCLKKRLTSLLLPLLVQQLELLSSATYSSPSDSSPRDASYSFTYDAGESSRSENADPNLNVKGTYSFNADDGIRRTVNYVAGSSTGFLAEGDHLPVAPDVPDFGSHTQPSSSGVVSTKSAPTTYVAPAPARPFAPSSPVEEAQVRSSALDDGSYSFSYETQSSSRHETADALNNVKGRYSFTADDDVNREIQYVAGAETGYIAEGDSLPQGPSVPGAESGIPTGRILPILSEEEANALAGVSPLLKSAGGSEIAGQSSRRFIQICL